MFDNITLWVLVYLLTGIATGYYLHRRDKYEQTNKDKSIRVCRT